MPEPETDLVELVLAQTSRSIQVRAAIIAQELKTTRVAYKDTRNALQEALRAIADGEAATAAQEAEIARLSAAHAAAETAYRAAHADALAQTALVNAMRARAETAEISLRDLLVEHKANEAALVDARTERDRLRGEEAGEDAALAAAQAEVNRLKIEVARLTPPVMPWEAYAWPPRLAVADVKVLPGAKQAHLLLRLVKADGTSYGSPHTSCYVTLGLTNGTGTNVGTNQGLMLPPYATVWRPGDDAEHWVTINLEPMSGRTAGNFVTVGFNRKGFAEDGGQGARIIFEAGAVNALPAQMPRHRPPRLLNLSGLGVPTADMKIDEMKWSSSGWIDNDPAKGPCWRSMLAHGRSQPGNGEVAVYTDKETFPNHPDPLVKETDSTGRRRLRMKSSKFPTAVTYESKVWNYQAVMIQAQRMREWCMRLGIYRSQIVAPSNRGAWSAFWTSASWLPSLSTHWPYEIDIFELFRAAFGAAYTNDETSSAQHLGKFGSSTRDRVVGLPIRLKEHGFASNFDFTTQVHDFACHITETDITIYVDGIETYCSPNMTVHHLAKDRPWAGHYPMLNVAVRNPTTIYPEAGQTSDMLVYGAQAYANVPAGVVSEMTAPRPWPNTGVAVNLS